MIEEKLDEVIQKHIKLAIPEIPTNTIEGMRAHVEKMPDLISALNDELTGTANWLMSQLPEKRDEIHLKALEYGKKYIEATKFK